jgi:hypothetical protein
MTNETPELWVQTPDGTNVVIGSKGTVVTSKNTTEWTRVTHDDTALLRQALDALENSAVKHPQQIEGKNAAITALRKRLNLCPVCGSDTITCHTEYTGIETFYDACLECEWRGEPE